MNTGLLNGEIEALTKVFANYPKIDAAVLFGSRAMGNFRNGSDIDIALFGTNITFNDFLQIQIACDDLELMQKIDLVHVETIENQDLIQHIQRVGISIYQK